MSDSSSKVIRPSKGILKTSTNYVYLDAGCVHKTFKFDEMNLLQTLHQGNMVNSRYSKAENQFHPPVPDHAIDLDADMLMQKLFTASNTQTPSFGDDALSDDEFPETEEETIRRIVFERRRKEHYKEFKSIEFARKLIEEEGLQLDYDESIDEDESIGTASALTMETSRSIGSDQSTEKSFIEEESTDKSSARSSSSFKADAAAPTVSLPSVKQRRDGTLTLSPSHPCFNRIKMQQQQEQVQKEQQQQEQQEQQ